MATKVIVASGLEIRDARQGQSLLQYLYDNADFDMKTAAWTYPKGAGAKARFEVSVVYTAKELATALDTADAYVVYSGHSRYGQGPAFGPALTALGVSPASVLPIVTSRHPLWDQPDLEHGDERNAPPRHRPRHDGGAA